MNRKISYMLLTFTSKVEEGKFSKKKGLKQ